MSKLVEKYYQRWLQTPKLFHPHDTEHFYRFVKACLKYKRESVRGSWLREKLERDLADKIGDAEYRENVIIKAVNLFEHLIDFHRTTFPDTILEMRNPYAVSLAMSSIGRQDGSKFYSRHDIERTLAENFGTDWENKYRNKKRK